ncbi:MAG: hypothetical protein JOY71_07220 [Acetobacteraceae bacterium]|nr:hypothetical protein [Acetobacteraceae bacterium]
MEYTIYAAVEEEYNEGWVWLCKPRCASRTLVELSHEDENHRRYRRYCEARHIEWNFLERYHDPGRKRLKIVHPSKALVISEWYRNALGGFGTQTVQEIDVRELPWWKWGWRTLRAANHHPDIVARIGTRLGVLGAWLGLIAIVPTIWDHPGPLKSWIHHNKCIYTWICQNTLYPDEWLNNHSDYFFLLTFLFIVIVAGVWATSFVVGPGVLPRVSQKSPKKFSLSGPRFSWGPKLLFKDKTILADAAYNGSRTMSARRSMSGISTRK